MKDQALEIASLSKAVSFHLAPPKVHSLTCLMKVGESEKYVFSRDLSWDSQRIRKSGEPAS